MQAEVRDGSLIMRATCLRDAAIKPDEASAQRLAAHVAADIAPKSAYGRVDEARAGRLEFFGGGRGAENPRLQVIYRMIVDEGSALILTTFTEDLDSTGRAEAFREKARPWVLSDPLCAGTVAFPSKPEIERNGVALVAHVQRRTGLLALLCTTVPPSRGRAGVPLFAEKLIKEYEVHDAAITSLGKGDKADLHIQGYVPTSDVKFRFEARVYHVNDGLIALSVLYDQNDEGRYRAADYLGLASPTEPSAEILTFRHDNCLVPMIFPISPGPAKETGKSVSTWAQEGRHSFDLSCTSDEGYRADATTANQLAQEAAGDDGKAQSLTHSIEGGTMTGRFTISRLNGRFERDVAFRVTNHRLQLASVDALSERYPRNDETEAFLSQLTK
ncbi:hypothetical protein GCM10007276_34310 [Agaricicola taiwanensis]|uniref:Uncharacterized protein n=1 Tax=Agaricicola taiwanensis TaxID=591372 RepID=A0A8J2YMV5_9RHOB|nr:hypothetical protein GCM10007276_34310 [Agaricicola taiwanensis]